MRTANSLKSSLANCRTWSRVDGDWLGTAYFGQKTGEFYRANFEFPFFNHFLKDKGDISQLKEINWFDTGTHEWRSLDTYTPPSVAQTPLYLTEGGGLSLGAAKGKAGYDEYVSDP